MISPRVTIVMPAYNSERFISQSIESVIRQTYGDWKLIVVDDGSFDGTRDIVSEYAGCDRRVSYVRQPHGGLGVARNTGIKLTGSQFVAFLDSDDLWLPEKLERQVKTLLDTRADIVYTGGRIFCEGVAGRPTSSFGVVEGMRRGGEMLSMLSAHNCIAVSSVMVRREALESVGCFDESPEIYGAEDYDLWLKIAARGRSFYGMSEKLVVYRVHQDSLSRNVRLMLDSISAVLRRNGIIAHAGDRSFRRMASNAYLDEYFFLVRRGEIAKALALLREAWLMAPLTVLRPRKLAAVVKNGLFGLVSSAITRGRAVSAADRTQRPGKRSQMATRLGAR